MFSEAKRPGEYHLYIQGAAGHYTAVYKCLRCGFETSFQTTDALAGAKLLVEIKETHKCKEGREP